MAKPFKTFETERLLIRPTSIDDAVFMYELMNTPKWIENIGDRKIHAAKEAKQYIIDKMLPQLKRLGYSNYTVVRKSDNIKLGTCGLYDREGLEGIDIGFAFLPQFEKKGYAFESVNRLKEAAISDFEITTIKAITIKENIDAQKLLEKIGLSFKGYINIPNDEEELLLYQFPS